MHERQRVGSVALAVLFAVALGYGRGLAECTGGCALAEVAGGLGVDVAWGFKVGGVGVGVAAVFGRGNRIGGDLGFVARQDLFGGFMVGGFVCLLFGVCFCLGHLIFLWIFF